MKLPKRTLKYIFKRVAYASISLLLLSVLIFTMSRTLPGDPARLAVGPRAPEETVERVRKKLNLDKPLYVQYFLWFKEVLSGDLGISLYTDRSVTTDIITYLPVTLELVFLAAFFEIVGGITIGVFAGSFPNKIPDHIGRFFAYLGIAVPSFAWAIIFQQLFTWVWPIFPTTGRISPFISVPPRITGFIVIDSIIAGYPGTALNAIWHMVLPALALSLGNMGQDARIIRQEMVGNTYKDYAAMARSYGMPSTSYRFSYLLKPSLIPAITVMGMDVASLLSYSFIVEMVFAYPGFSKYGIEVMLRSDFNAIIGVVIVIGVIFIIANIVVDTLVRSVDPRILFGQ